MNLSNKQFDFLMGCLLVSVLGFTLTKAYVSEKRERAALENRVYQDNYSIRIASVK